MKKILKLIWTYGEINEEKTAEIAKALSEGFTILKLDTSWVVKKRIVRACVIAILIKYEQEEKSHG